MVPLSTSWPLPTLLVLLYATCILTLCTPISVTFFRFPEGALLPLTSGPLHILILSLLMSPQLLFSQFLPHSVTSSTITNKYNSWVFNPDLFISKRRYFSNHMLFPPRKETELMGEIHRPHAGSKAMTEQAFFSKKTNIMTTDIWEDAQHH